MPGDRRTIPAWAVIAVIVIAIAALGVGSRFVDRTPPPLGSEIDPAESGRRREPPGRRAEPDGWERHVLVGVPSDASETTPEDYLIRRAQYVVSYNQRRGIPNWVAWHLQASDFGPAPRSDFEPDSSLPSGFYQVTPKDYRGSGYGRGHLCPSGDRTSSRDDNAATFLMTNVVPQVDDNNQGPWNDLEMACRDWARSGSELYVVAGGSGPFTQLRTSSKVFAPEAVWKVALVIESGPDDLTRIDGSARVIAVSMPNRGGIRDVDWRQYLTTVDAIEQATGLDFFAELPDEVEAELESRVEDSSSLR